MKDKLVKTGRKGNFYKARRFFLGTLLFATLAATITVTTVISVSGSVKAQEEKVTDVESEKTSEDSESILLY